MIDVDCMYFSGDYEFSFSLWNSCDVRLSGDIQYNKNLNRSESQLMFLSGQSHAKSFFIYVTLIHRYSKMKSYFLSDWLIYTPNQTHFYSSWLCIALRQLE